MNDKKDMIAASQTYRRPPLMFSKHMETIYPALIRSVKTVQYERERISTPDDDFLDLDRISNKNPRVVIISHGLEGSADRPYVKGMARIFANNGYDVVAWNFRGCSGEMNRNLRFYHSGATDDLHTVVNHIRNNYEEINLVGFSLGGNLTLKYLGENHSIPIHKAIAFSVPLHLHDACIQISKPSNFLYARRFLRHLKEKVRLKSQQINVLKTADLPRIKTLIEFDDYYTAPLHGFDGAIDYYEKCSALYFIHDIQTPTVIVNAENDPFLTGKCFLNSSGIRNSYVQYLQPKHGGHVGFSQFNKEGHYWSEQLAFEFIDG